VPKAVYIAVAELINITARGEVPLLPQSGTLPPDCCDLPLMPGAWAADMDDRIRRLEHAEPDDVRNSVFVCGLTALNSVAVS